MAREPSFLLGLDIGGSGARCLLVDAQSGEALRTARSWAPIPAPGGGTDLNLDTVWSRLGQAIREGLERAGARPEQILGVAAAGMRFGTVALDAQGAVRLAAPNIDTRGVAAGLKLAAEHGEALEATSGHWPSPISTTARLLSLTPEDRSALDCVFSVNDWLAWRLCGERVTDPSHAGGTLLYDLRAGAWSEEWTERLAVPIGLLPEIRACGSRLGEVGVDAAEALGLAAGTPVAVGGGDSQLGLLGLGALEPGQAGAVCGTTLPVMAVVASPDAGRPGLWLEPHVVPGRFVLESNAGPVGEALDWLGRLLRPQAPNGAERLLAEAAAAPVGAGGMVSTFGVQVMDGRVLSLPVGELSLSHFGHADSHRAVANLARSVVEGMAFALRANLEQAAVGGTPELRLGGRMVLSPVWQKAVAAALGRPVIVGAVTDATGLGAALCAGVGAGCFPDLAAAASALVETHSVEPAPEEAAVLTELYTQWRELQEARRPAAAITQGLALRGLLQSSATVTAASSAPRDLRILVTADMDEEALAAFRELGQVEYASYREARRLLTGKALVEALCDVDVFVTEIDLVDAASVLELPRLRVVVSCRGDAVNVDVEACSVLGVPVLNAPGRNADAVADLTLAFLLALARKLPEANAFLREPGMRAGDMGAMGRAYGTLRGQELWRRTIGLVGLGAVGRKVAERLAPFGVRLLACDPWQDPAAITRAGASPVSLETLLAESDFVSLHATVSDDTTGLIDADALARMKPGAMLVNTARAALVDEDALLDALQAGRLAGAALDVFSEEPPGADHPLLSAPGVIATPHIGGNTVQIGAHQGHIVSKDLARLMRGEAPRCALNPEVAERFDWNATRTRPDEATCQALRKRPPPAVSDLHKPRKKKRPPGRTTPKAAPQPTILESEREELRQGMIPVLGAFVRAFAADATVQRACRGQDVTLYFVLEDLGLDFHLRLREQAGGALGAPDREPEVTLRLRAEVLDGMFTGRLRAMDEAMAGHLSFSGDAAKAMTLQQLEADLERLYSAARQEAGPPGDLSRTAPR